MFQRLLYVMWTVALMLAMPVTVLARGSDDEGPVPDARYLGYKVNVVVAERKMALLWMLLIFLVGICIAAIFKNAKRTHLD